MSSRENRGEDSGEDEVSKEYKMLKHALDLKEKYTPKTATADVEYSE